jgi:hypothetical protein
MDSFQKVVLFAAIVVLIIALVLIGMSLRYSTDQNWPPMTSECPDYWTIDGSGNNAKCINAKDLGTCPAQTGDEHLIMNFNNAVYAGSNGTCAKYTWATKCGVSWDGITYGVNNPCQTA